MRNSQRFEGLEEDEITWYSNIACKPLEGLGLEEDKLQGSQTLLLVA